MEETAKKQFKVVTMIKDKVEVHKNRSDIEKDIRNPLRRVYRHTIRKNKYGDMNEYHSRACSYYCNAPTPDINQVVEDTRAKMQADLEAIWAKEEEKAQKKAEKQAERVAKKEEREAARAAKKTQKDLTDEVMKMAEENTEALQNIVDELHEINKEAEEDFREVKPEEKAVNGVGTGEDLINNNPNITKGEDGLYHFTPVIFHNEEDSKVEEEAKAEEPVEEKKEETPKAKKEPKVPQDKKPAAKKSSTKKVKK